VKKRPATAALFAVSLSSYTTHSSFSQELVDKYDAFILDQFGVLHNGAHALEGAIELVNYLASDQKKKLIILSNTSAPSDKAMLKLPKLGFEAHHFLGAVTSGEEAAKYIQAQYGANSDTNDSSKALMMTWDASDLTNPRLTALPEAFLEKCGPQIQLASTVEEADWLLLHGSEVWYRGDGMDQLPLSFIETGSMESVVEPLLQQCLERNLPCICANPDHIVQTPTGGTAYMPGAIAQRYQDMGGSVQWFGKPQPTHFLACLDVLGLPADRVAHVGDSLHHDISGANQAGISNIFVTSGIHRSDLNVKFGELPKQEQLQDLFDREGGIIPTHVVPAFRR